jgi:(p)ppGpp synthase/HD superfamily hydrolase
MITKNVDLHEIKDLIAFRLIVQKLKDCYKVLDIIKDYIATPKHNGYRSLHVIISDNEFMRNVEIQVRTKKMHNVAESGSASHSIYKDQKKSKINSLSHTVLDDLGTEKAYEIWRSFEWTIPELDTYEQELKKVLHHYKAEKVTT